MIQIRGISELKSLAPDNKSILKTVCGFYKINDGRIFLVRRGTENKPGFAAIYLISAKPEQ